MYEVELWYFKDSGKFYSEGKYITDKEYLHEIFEEIKLMLFNGNRPGLVHGSDGFHVLVRVPTHPNNYPKLFIGGG